MVHNTKDISGYHAGDALEIVVTVYDSDGNIKDLSNGSAEWLLKENSSDPDADALLTKDTAGGGVALTDAANGEVTVYIDTNDTSGMNGVKHHRCRVTDADGRRSTVFHGDFEISL